LVGAGADGVVFGCLNPEGEVNTNDFFSSAMLTFIYAFSHFFVIWDLA
jgi:copper homeostasis protein CutC